MSKFVASALLTLCLSLATCGQAWAGQPHPLCLSFWKEAWEDPFGCKAKCAAEAPAACPEPAPASTTPAAEPAPPATPDAPPAPATAQTTTGQRRSYSYDPMQGSQSPRMRSSSRAVSQPRNPFRADRKLLGL